MAIFTTFRTEADAEAVLPALLKLGVMQMSKSAMESPIVWQWFYTTRGVVVASRFQLLCADNSLRIFHECVLIFLAATSCGIDDWASAHKLRTHSHETSSAASIKPAPVTAVSRPSTCIVKQALYLPHTQAATVVNHHLQAAIFSNCRFGF